MSQNGIKPWTEDNEALLNNNESHKMKKKNRNCNKQRKDFGEIVKVKPNT